MLLNSDHAQKIIDQALHYGADFCDIFVEKRHVQNINILSGKVFDINSGVNFGIGIRLIYGEEAVYGHTNQTDLEELLRITEILAALDKRDQRVTSTPLIFTKTANIHSNEISLVNDIPSDEKVSFLKKIDLAARAISQKITQVNVSSVQWMQNVEIFNSENLHVRDTRPYTRIIASSIVEDAGVQARGFEGPGAVGGWEFTNSINPQQLAEVITQRALTKLAAAPCPAGEMPVILGNGFGGVIFHEACGHLLETTAVAKKASVFHDQMGEMIASKVVSAVDDGTLTNTWGSINIDDEGMASQKTQLIKDGKLTSFMVDKLGAIKTGYKRTGSARKENYKYAPSSRMRNTYIESGNDKFEDMIASIDHGIYAKKMGGGSVSPGTGEFNFNADESYLIENGKITKPLKSATLIGSGALVLKNISMISDDFELDTGMCGSRSGTIPTSVGQAALKIDNILVGGQE